MTKIAVQLPPYRNPGGVVPEEINVEGSAVVLADPIRTREGSRQALRDTSDDLGTCHGPWLLPNARTSQRAQIV